MPFLLSRCLPVALLFPLCLCLPARAQESAAEPSLQMAQMQTVEDAWDAAVSKRDQFGLENLLAPDFVGIGAAGEITTRNQQIANFFIAGAEPLTLRQKVVSARVLGSVAVVNGTYVMEWQSGEQKVAEKGVFTHVFNRNAAGRWQCINSQRTVVATDEERKKAAAQTKSNAALPLHIPLFYKGAKSTQPAPAAGSGNPPN